MKYRVELMRTEIYTRTVDVEADSEREAEQEAIEQQQGEDWGFADGNDDTLSVSEIGEDGLTDLDRRLAELKGGQA